MNNLILGLGGNKGDVKNTFQLAEKWISNEIGKIEIRSSIYKTAAWGKTNQPDFLNKVIFVNTKLDVDACLCSILEIEKKLGRHRKGMKWGERTIDIDILFFNDLIINKKDLIVPHPYLHKRKFVLIPTLEILPDLVHPKLKKTLNNLLKVCDDTLDVQVDEQ